MNSAFCWNPGHVWSVVKFWTDVHLHDASSDQEAHPDFVPNEWNEYQMSIRWNDRVLHG